MKRRCFLSLLVAVLVPWSVMAVDKEELAKDVKYTLEQLQKQDSGIRKFLDTSYGYAIFPRVAKGGIGFGGAYGNGQVFEKGKLVGAATVSQVTVGFQLGGQVYSEVIFFEDEKAMDSFKQSKFALSAQASAVAAAEGASSNAKYQLGVAIFTMARGGLMYEASVGGQKFKFTPEK